MPEIASIVLAPAIVFLRYDEGLILFMIVKIFTFDHLNEIKSQPRFKYSNPLTRACCWKDSKDLDPK